MKFFLTCLLGSLALLLARAQTPTKPLISFTTNRVTVSESAGTVLLEIRRSRVVDVPVSVIFSVVGFGRGKLVHCVPVTNVVEFAAGETNKFVPVTLIDDDQINIEEYAYADLTRIGTTADLGVSSVALVITDDDRIKMGLKYPKTWDETNGVQVLQAYRTGGLGKTSEVTVAISNESIFGSPTTFLPLTRRLTFLPGVTNIDVPVTLRRDYLAKADELATIRLLNPTPANSGFLSDSVVIRNVDSGIQFKNLPLLTEQAGTVNLPLLRLGPTNESASLDLVVLEGTAKTNRDFRVPMTKIEFAPGEREKGIPLVLLDNSEADGDRTFQLLLINPKGVESLPPLLTLTIVDDDNDSAVPSTVTVLDDFAGSGIEPFVECIRRMPDGRLLVGGSFSKIFGIPVKSVALLLPDGTLDQSFNPGSGAVGSVQFALPLANGQVLALGGYFSSFAGVPRTNAVRLKSDGSVDADYQLNLDSPPRAVAPTPEGGWWVGGSFTKVNGDSRKWLLRLLPDGTPDPSWPGETTLTQAPFTLESFPSGQLLHNGGHTLAPVPPDGTLRTLVRINIDGSLDSSFTPPLFEPTYQKIVVLADGSIAGENQHRWLTTGTPDLTFKSAGTVLATMSDGSMLKSVSSYRGQDLRRLYMDGSVQRGAFASFDLGGAKGLVVLPDDTIVAVGFFTQVNSQPRQGIVHLRFAAPDKTTIRWHGAVFGSEEDRGPIKVPVLRTGPVDTETTVAFATRPVDATPGKDYESSQGSLIFAPGERLKFVEIAPLPDDEFEADEALEVVLTGAAVEAAGSVAKVVLQSNESQVQFAVDEVSCVEGGNNPTIRILREGGLAYDAVVGWDRSGTATPYRPEGTDRPDYASSANDTAAFSQGKNGTWLSVGVSTYDDQSVEGVETAIFQLRPVDASTSLAPDHSKLTIRIIDEDSVGVGVEMLPAYTQVFPRLGEGVWLQNRLVQSLEGPAEPGPVGLLADGAIDPAFIVDSANAHGLLKPPADGTLMQLRTEGNSQTGYVYRFSKLTPTGRPDPSYDPLLIAKGYVPSDGHGGDFFTVGPGGSIIALSFEPDSSATIPLTRMLLVRLFDRSGNSTPNWVNTELMVSGGGYPSFSSSPLLPGCVTLDSGAVLIPGRLRPRWQTNSATIRPLVRISPVGSLDPDYLVTLDPNGWIGITTALPGDRCAIAGGFYTVNGVLRPGLARLQADGSVDPGFVPDLPPTITQWNSFHSLAQGPAGQIWACRSVDAFSYELLAFDAQGKALPGFASPIFDGPVLAIVPLADGKVVVSGAFNLVGSAFRSNYAWLDSSGKVLPAAPLLLTLETPLSPASPRFRLGARFSGQATLESSQDLKTWLPVKSFDVFPGEMDLELPGFGVGEGDFFRVRR